MSNPEKSTSKSDFKYKSKTLYELTIAPNDQYQGFTLKQCTKRFVQWRKNIYKKLTNLLDDVSKYYMIPEITQPQSSHKCRYPRLHLHGIIMFNNDVCLYTFLIDRFKDLSDIGLLQFNQFRENHWVGYMKKDSAYFTKYCKSIGTNYEFANISSLDRLFFLLKKKTPVPSEFPRKNNELRE